MIQRRRLLPAFLVSQAIMLGWIQACTDQPLGIDRDLRLTLLNLPADSISASPADTVDLAFRVADRVGASISGAPVRVTVAGEGAGIASSDPVSGLDGSIRVRWVLGVKAAEPQTLELQVQYGSQRQSLTLTARVIPNQVAELTVPDSLATRLHTPATFDVVATDPYGNRFQPGVIGYYSTDTTIFTVDSSGVIRGRSRGFALAVVSSGGQADTMTVSIFQVAGAIAAPDSQVLHSIGEVATIRFTILSDSGREIRDTIPQFSLADTTVAALVLPPADTGVVVRSRANGSTSLTVTVGEVTREVTIEVRQRSASLQFMPHGPVAFDALGDSLLLTAQAFDSLGVLLAAPVISFTSADSTIVAAAPGGLIRSAGNGTAVITAREITGASASLPVTVTQVIDTLVAFWTDTASIVSGAQFAPPPLTCVARDRNGFPLPQSPAVVTRNGTLFGSDCATLTVRASGFDTLTITAGSQSIELPFILAVRPLVSAPAGAFVALDSFPFDFRLWAPSGRVNSQGEIEIYVTGYEYVLDSNGVGPGALHRLTSSDGTSFRYDGIALDRPVPCGLICSGIENVAVVPRSDGPGWRMYFAAGSSGTYGWQLFSAVSGDERNWTMEPGIRIDNGGSVPPQPPATAPWPVGEGLVVDQLPGGAWRMIIGGYERIPNPPNRFAIVEYRSSDQLTWSYVGPVLTPSALPPTAQRSIYSPSVVEVTPGIWRMFFAGDDTNLPGGRSRIFSAVSLDRATWKFEQEILGAPGTSLFYSALVNNRLYFLRQDTGDLRRLAFATLTMP